MKNYMVLGFDLDDKPIFMSRHFFASMELALEYMHSIDEDWRPFIVVRLTMEEPVK